MTISNIKIYIIGAAVVILTLVIILFIFQGIQKSSQELIFQKKELALFEQEERSSGNFQKEYETYQKNLEKINIFFINPALPIEFIRFLEESASDSKISIKISLAKEITESEHALSFNVTLSGSFADFLKFADKLENGPYLVEINNLNVKKLSQGPVNNVTANLELIVLAK